LVPTPTDRHVILEGVDGGIREHFKKKDKDRASASCPDCVRDVWRSGKATFKKKQKASGGERTKRGANK